MNSHWQCFRLTGKLYFPSAEKKKKSFAVENDQILPYKINDTNTQTQGLLGDMTIIKGKIKVS